MIGVVLAIGGVLLRRLPINEDLRQALLMFITLNLFQHMYDKSNDTSILCAIFLNFENLLSHSKTEKSLFLLKRSLLKINQHRLLLFRSPS